MNHVFLSRLWRIAAYLSAVTAPVILASVWGGGGDDPIPVQFADKIALLAFAILVMQFVLSARLRWIERPFGLDRIFAFHKTMALVAASLLLAHPSLLAAFDSGPQLLFGLRQPWPVLLGRACLLLLIVVVVASRFRVALRFEYQKWRATHNAFVLLLLAGISVHSLLLGPDLKQNPGMRTLWGVFLALAVAAYLNHMLWQRWKAARHAYRVTEVIQETSNVWTLRFAPPEGLPRPSYQPGQFHFLTLQRGAALPPEEHLFSISSSPLDPFLSSTIKESGDFTKTIRQTKVGDRAFVEGPFGCFSFKLHENLERLVFIAGGIGITPLMSMLRYLHSTRSQQPVLLIYANRNEPEIVFREELDRMAEAKEPPLNVVHVISRPSAEWQGEQGRIDSVLLRKYCGEALGRSSFYLCAPPPMIAAVSKELVLLGAPRRHIHAERFSL